MAAAAPTPKLVIAGLGKTYRTGRGDTVALRGVDLAIEDNEFVALVGTSGCGKCAPSRRWIQVLSRMRSCIT